MPLNIDDLTVGDLKQIQKLMGCTSIPQEPFFLPIGSNIMVRTVTMIQVGKLEAVGTHELALRDAAWVADTGRFSDMLKNGSVNECEPFPEGLMVVGRGALIDACIWPHPLLRSVK